MKIRKQLGLFLAACVLLCGCSADVLPAGSGNPAVNREGEAATAPTAGSIVPCGASTEQGYYRSDIYFVGGANISYIDYQTKADVFLCSSPNCSHRDETCKSFYPFEGTTQLSGVQVVGEHLLAIQAVVSEWAVPHIDMLSLDGTFERLLVEFDANHRLPGEMENSYFTDGAYLYFVLADVDPNTTQHVQSIVSVSLEDGTVKTLYTPANGALFLAVCGGYNRTLVYRETMIQEGEDTIDNYWEIDIDSGLTTKLPYDSFEEHGIEVRGENLYEMNFSGCNITIHNLLTGEEKHANFSPLNEEIVAKYGDNVLSSVAPLPFTTDACVVRYAILDPQSETTHVEHVLDMKTGEVVPFTLFKKFNDNIMQVVAQLSGKLLIQEDWIPIEMQGQSNEPYEIYLPKFRLLEQEEYLRSALTGDEIKLLPVEPG